MSGLRGQVPNLVLAQRVIDKIAAAASQYMQDETGEGMLGVVEPGTHTNGVPTVYVLETVPPDETDVVREYYTFQHGGEHQYEIFTWYLENWLVYRSQLGDTLQDAKWNHPLIHVGDWHKQPGYMIAPSGPDLRSAMEQLMGNEDTNAPGFLIVPIVTLNHPDTTRDGPGVNYLLIPARDGSHVRVDFWYVHRDLGVFQPITPVVYPDDQLPPVPALPWHIADPARADLEIEQLRYAGWLLSIVLWNTDGVIPVEVCVMAAQQNQSTVTLLVTQHDFPKSAPKAYRAPFIPMRDGDGLYAIFEKMWSQATPIDDPPGWEWSPDLYLIDYVTAIQDVEAKKTAPPVPAETSSSAPTTTPADTAPVAEAAPASPVSSPSSSPASETSPVDSAQTESSGGGA